MGKCIVIGGGAAGMMAAYAAAKQGVEVTLLEKNEKLGKKIYITGKGRCNVTNACEVEDLFKGMISNPKFMYSSFYQFTNNDVMQLINNYGCPLKVERGNRVFPISDRSSDVIFALQKAMKEVGVIVKLNTEVTELIVEDGIIRGVRIDKDKLMYADRVICATGGLSYETTGSSGDGYRFAKSQGIEVLEPKPALTPFICREEFCKEIMGLSLKNVELTLKSGKKEIYRDFGEMLFTHFGISGPLVLSASSYYVKKYFDKEIEAYIDLKPALSIEQLDKRVLREFEDNQNKQFKNVIGSLFPNKLTPIMIELSNIDPDQKVNIISKEQRMAFVQLIKALPLTIIGTRGFSEAIITQGGISVKEINPSTMESKKVAGLYFAGEVLDLDAVTGGYNLQIAWSTGFLAGDSLNI